MQGELGIPLVHRATRRERHVADNQVLRVGGQPGLFEAHPLHASLRVELLRDASADAVQLDGVPTHLAAQSFRHQPKEVSTPDAGSSAVPPLKPSRCTPDHTALMMSREV